MSDRFELPLDTQDHRESIARIGDDKFFADAAEPEWQEFVQASVEHFGELERDGRNVQ